MTTTAWILLAITGAFAVVDWLAVGSANTPLEYVAKPATLAALIGVALTLDPTRSDQRAWFVVALVCSLAGDVFLMLPKDLFVAGLASFLVGHVAYVVGLNRGGGSAIALALAAIPVALAGLALGARYARALLAAGDRRLAGPVVAYVAVIATMVASALATGNPLAGGGAVLFMCSDALIGWHRFVQPLRWAPVAIIVTYHVGQVGLTCSLVR